LPCFYSNRYDKKTIRQDFAKNRFALAFAVYLSLVVGLVELWTANGSLMRYARPVDGAKLRGFPHWPANGLYQIMDSIGGNTYGIILFIEDETVTIIDV
jgi:hypothetical protein